jgi:hypothetical protein
MVTPPLEARADGSRPGGVEPTQAGSLDHAHPTPRPAAAARTGSSRSASARATLGGGAEQRFQRDDSHAAVRPATGRVAARGRRIVTRLAGTRACRSPYLARSEGGKGPPCVTGIVDESLRFRNNVRDRSVAPAECPRSPAALLIAQHRQTNVLARRTTGLARHCDSRDLQGASRYGSREQRVV